MPLVAALAVDAIGSGLFLPLSLLYFRAVTGLPLTTVGTLLSIATVAALPIPLLVGRLADRYRPRDIVLVAQLIQATGFAGYLVVHGAASMLIAAAVVMIGQRVFWSAFYAMVSALDDDSTDPRRTDRRFAQVGMVRMAGISLGTLLGGLAVAGGHYRPIVLINTLTFLLSAAVLLRVPRGAPRPAATGPDGGYRVLLRDRPYLLLIAANTIFTLCSYFVGVALPVYLVDGLPGTAWLVGPLLAVNTVILALGQGLAVRLVRPFSRAFSLALAGALWAAWGLAYAAAPLFPRGPALIACVSLGLLFYTAADVVHAPVSNALAAQAAPVAQRGRYLAVFQYGWAIAQVIAPAFFTSLYARGRPLPWLALALLALAASALTLTLRPHLATFEQPEPIP